MAGLSRPETKNDEHSPESNGSSMRSGAISSRNYLKKLIKKNYEMDNEDSFDEILSNPDKLK